MPACPRPIRCKLLTMSLARTWRLRLAMALALCAVLWSDPAIAELLCAATPACPHHAAPTQQRFPSVSGVKPCCPAHRAPLSAPADGPACCASDSGAILPAASFLSGNNGPKRALACVAASPFASLPADQSLLLTSETTVSCVKPVDQKKTDLRI